jgi:hypothetical protein
LARSQNVFKYDVPLISAETEKSAKVIRAANIESDQSNRHDLYKTQRYNREPPMSYLTTTSAFVSAVTLLFMAARLQAAPIDTAPLYIACAERMPDIQQNRRTCVVGIVREGGELDVLVSTRDIPAGHKLSVFSSSVLQRGITRLAELAALTDQIVVVGGFLDNGGLYSAKLLSGVR